MKKYCLLFLTTSFALIISGTQAQSTWEHIHTVFQNNCSASGCHGGSNPNVFNVDSPASSLYMQLVNVDPLNPWARDSSGNKLIDPCNPSNSFLLRKLACGTGPEPALVLQEGACMPNLQPYQPLPAATIDTIRAWIAACAPDTGIVEVSGIEEVLVAGHLELFPNPFSGRLKVKYTLTKVSETKVELFDAKGVKITYLPLRLQTAGTYEYDLLSDQMTLEAGIYLVRFVVGDQSITKRIIRME